MARSPHRTARLALYATICCDVFLLVALASWYWRGLHPDSLPWRVPVVAVTLSLASGAVALVASRRSNRVVLFLCALLAVLTAAWLWSQIYAQIAPPQPLWVR